VFLLFQAVLKTIFLKMNLDSKRSRGRREAELPLNPFKKKRELFLIFQLSICKYKFNVTIKDIYNAHRECATSFSLVKKY